MDAIFIVYINWKTKYKSYPHPTVWLQYSLQLLSLLSSGFQTQIQEKESKKMPIKIDKALIIFIIQIQFDNTTPLSKVLP